MGLIGTALLAAFIWLLLQVLSLRRRTAALEYRVRALHDPQIPGKVEPVPEPAPSARPGTDWEALVGTNWLNRLGALMLVIGIVLFVGYSLSQLGPKGKITIGALLGLILIGAGVLLEKQAVWRTYSFSLMGAGWAVLYFTAYAAWAVPAARVLTSATGATLLLILVSAGMIAHSVTYQSETATALAWLLGFIGLNVGAPTSFGLVAGVVLAITLAVIAFRYSWHRLPLLGAVLVYVMFVIQSEGDVPGAAVALWLYWLTFESYDLIETHRHVRDSRLERAAFLVNFGGFAGAAWLSGLQTQVHEWFLFCLMASAAYLLSAGVRRYAAASAGDIAQDSGYELASAGAAVMLAGGLFNRFAGGTLTIALLFEAELVVLAALSLQAPLLRVFGSLALIVPALHVSVDALNGIPWTIGALATAAAFILNRFLIEHAWYFTLGAAVLLVAVATHELPHHTIAPTFSLVGIAAEFIPMADVRWTGLAAIFAAAIAAGVSNIPGREILGSIVTITAVFSSQRLQTLEFIRITLTITGAVLTTAILDRQVPPHFFTVSVGAEGAVLLAIGFLLRDRIFRLTGLAVLLFSLVRLFAFDLRQLDTMTRIVSFLLLGVVLLAASWVYTRFRDKLSRLL